MDGLECSEVPFSNLNLGDRFDAEYFSKKYLNISKALKMVATRKLGEISKAIASAFYPPATQLYSIGDTPFVRCVDCINYPVITAEQEDMFEKIPYSFGKSNKGISFLKNGEIVITKVGTPCYASIIEDYEEVALSRTVMGLSSIREIDPYYLVVFLRSKYGFEQLYRQRELTIQYQLTLSRIKAIDIFMASCEYQKKIREMCVQYRTQLSLSKKKYGEATDILISALNYHPIKQTESNATKSFSESFEVTGRLDAEYYQPKYDDLFALLKKLPTKPLGALVHIRKSIEPGSEFYGDEGIPFIRVSDVSEMGISTPAIRIPKTTLPSIETLYPKKDTILFSKDGSVGIAYKVDKDTEAVTSSALLHLSVKNPQEVLPDYLALALNSDVVRLQAERDTNGAILQHWRLSDISKAIVPILSYDVQQEIAERVQESFAMQRKAERMIQAAVKSVEIAIEQNEASALDYLNESTSE